MEKDKKSLLTRIIKEYKKVTWADKATVFQVTIIVLLITAFVAIMVMAFDFSFKHIIELLQNVIRKIAG